MIDYHVHSTYSMDGQSSLHSYVYTAQECNLKEIGFAEHVDLDPYLWGYNFLDFPRYRAALTQLQESTSLPIRCGIEVSYQPHLEGSIKEYISQTECDFVIGSVHEVDRVTMDRTFLQRYNPQEYFKTTENLITSGICDIVGHLEYFKRWGGSYSSLEYKDDICGLLQQMIEHHLVLEINTSGLRHPCQDTYPSLEVITWYKELGGELICLGSDAHHTEDTAFQFSSVIKQLKLKGFKIAANFSKRTLNYVEL
ncbi:MAG: hypothetical protein AYK19_19105 [Theionarchaea archaeon DG-70-1]|nr:MAG: hypothetical protein AYK19_19105 [Theionarchaea archaeon DG-70-1]